MKRKTFFILLPVLFLTFIGFTNLSHGLERKMPTGRAIGSGSIPPSGCAIGSGSIPPPDPVKLFTGARAGGTYAEETAESLQAARRLFQLLSAASFTTESIQWAAETLDMDFRAIRHRGETIYILSEKENKKRGRGFYLFRKQGEPILLQAPHSGNDRFTGTIVLSLFLETGARVAAFNTVSRKQTDLAKNPYTFFQALTEVFGRAFPRKGRVIQFHGFLQSKRRSSAGEKARVIFSSGSPRPTLHLRAATACVRRSLPPAGDLLIYPEDIRELGGTLNIQARTLALLDFYCFFHIEMNLGFRKKMKDNFAFRNTFYRCLTGDDSKEAINR